MLKLSAKSGRMGRWHGQPLASVWPWTPLIPLSRGNWPIRDTAQSWKSPCIVAKLLACVESSFCTMGTVMPFTHSCCKDWGSVLERTYNGAWWIHTYRRVYINSIGDRKMHKSFWSEPLTPANVFIWVNARFINFGLGFKQNLAWCSTFWFTKKKYLGKGELLVYNSDPRNIQELRRQQIQMRYRVCTG